MGLRFRKRLRLGPFRFNLSWSQGRGFSNSKTFKLGPFSRNSRNKGWRVDLPGGGHWAPSRKTKRRAPAGTTQQYYLDQEAKERGRRTRAEARARATKARREARAVNRQSRKDYGRVASSIGKNRSGTVRVRAHTRAGVPVRAHERHI